MNTVPTSVRLPEDLVARYTRLAETTGRTRNFLMQEALEHYIEQEEWQLAQVDEVLAALDAGTLETVSGEELIAQLLSEGKITTDGLNEAYHRCGLPEDAPTPGAVRTPDQTR
ncbi:MAG TPA: CopG family ribbon-helix-helix protein [Chloroflexota bacterium]|jgi:predicted transcriptional regulator|nr:CopG family ribbon-helix-helix protein [Chloroflexota bacterium]